MKRPFVSMAAAALLSAACVLTPLASAAEETTAYIDNSALIPKIVDDSQVVMEDSGNGLMSPDWVKTLIIGEITIARCTPEGTFQAAVKVLDHYQEMGINGLWLTPVFDTSQGTGGHYGNFGPHTVDPALTGTEDYEEGWAVVKEFVNECHKRNIRVFSDIITWGVEWNAPLYVEKPAWFAGENAWGGYSFNWNNEEFVEWFKVQSLNLITNIGFDGLRCDCEPSTTGYGIFLDIRERALAAGRKVCIFSENTNERLQPAYDFDEHSSESFTWNNWEMYTEYYNIVESVKKGYGLGTNFQEILDESGTARFYAFNTSCHDQPYTVKGSLVNFGYQSLLAPFIPIFFMGEEFNNPLYGNSTAFLTPLQLDLLEQPENRAFYESVKEIIRIRRTYPEIFNYFPQNHRESNICEVEVVGLETLTGYARYMDGKGILVVPNNNVHDTTSPFTIRIPYEDMGIPESAVYKVTDLRTGKEIARGDRISLYDFQATVAYNDLGVYMVEAVTGAAPAANAADDPAEAQPQAAPAGQEAAAPQQEPQTEQAAQDKALMAGNQAAPLPGGAAAAPAAETKAGGILPVILVGVLGVSGAAGAFFLVRTRQRRRGC